MTVVAVVVAPFFAAIIIATWSGGRCGRSSAELLGTWSTWSVVDVVEARWNRSAAGCGLLDGSLRLANGSNSLLDGSMQSNGHAES